MNGIDDEDGVGVDYLYFLVEAAALDTYLDFGRRHRLKAANAEDSHYKSGSTVWLVDESLKSS